MTPFRQVRIQVKQVRVSPSPQVGSSTDGKPSRREESGRWTADKQAKIMTLDSMWD